MLVREIIVTALNELQVYGAGEDVAPVDMARGFQSLNVMLDSWSTENLACFATLEQSIVLKPTVSQYTIGPGGTIDTSQGKQRPIRLIEGPGAAYILDSNSNKFGVNVVPREKWNLIGNLTVNSNVPDTIFYDAQFPTAFLNVFPVPNIGWTLYFDSYSQLAAMPSLDMDITLPPGYAKALGHNLAIELEPLFPSAKLSKITVALAATAKANIKRSNSQPIMATFDSEIVSKARGSYNIYSDGYSSSGGR